ncbi:ABC transporter substrate-binding protein [Novosphingobium rosa]|uniref:ABC transporter substrate-binding protein n=1 Tax=Novosphingobium rosa TaxID=76978 RepID=UPI0008330191|nr:ABC transporter substrate-binding protein [Novosphingobium rosa]
MTITRRSALRGMLAGTLASTVALAACKHRARGLVLGDQVHLIESKLRAAHALDGTTYPLSFANFQGAAPLLEALNAGAVDTAPAGDLPVILAAAAGCKLKIAGINQTSGRSMAIVVPPRSPIASVKDLAGRSVIVSSARGSISHYLLLEALREAHVPIGSVKIGFMLPTEAAAAFASGQIEAWGTFGIYQAKAEAAGARILRDGTGIGPGYGIIAVSEAALADADKRAALADVLARSRTANQWCRDHIDAYAALYARQTGIAPALARIMVGRENPALVAPDAAFVAALQRAADRFHEDYGVLPRRVDIAALIAPGLLPA